MTDTIIESVVNTPSSQIVKRDELNSTVAGKGASQIGVQDSGGYYAGATVEAVLQEIGLNKYINTYVAKTADYTLLATDFQIECTSGTFTLTLPTAVGIAGRVYSMKNTGDGLITIDANGSQTIDGELTQTLYKWDNMQVMSNGTNRIII